ncbi:uncharacterized protein LOC119334174 [Triticum dicoccoides]|uniref:F-box domain-containing protein n=1 Tax=Triticum turgidum subsp. durum TaxID=4567 RepID=A0A9R1BV23_TRITD|nr:uncharacterized protein LOC119334174 [Triticum dicoccoides]VAI82165.1 unnamed protein product [Triticum turgidum subsp. durum]
MAPPAPPNSPDGDAPPAMESQEALPEHVVDDIFLRLPTAEDLARASMASASFRRIIAARSFLRRFRALHRPPLLGVLAYESSQRANLSVAFLPAQPPHPAAAAAAHTLARADFSCSFLPSPELWINCDFRDGRALLSKQGDFLANLAVCDPLHRRYVLLPALPDDLAALTRELDVIHCHPFLAPAGQDRGDNADAPSGFRVMCLLRCSSTLVLFIFSSSGARAGQWRTVTFGGWGALMAGHVSVDFFLATLSTRRHYAHGCFYWEIPYTRKLLVFDTRTEEFSSLSTPRGHYQMVFVEAMEGRLGMFSRSIEDDGKHLLYDILQDNGDGTKEWRREDVISVPYKYHYDIIGVAGGCLLLHGNVDNPESPEFHFSSYSLDLQTMKLKWFRGTQSLYFSPHSHLYDGFPPSLSPPTI